MIWKDNLVNVYEFMLFQNFGHRVKSLENMGNTPPKFKVKIDV
jgi:hypothetical protein